ncbi:MAG: ASCH domain-containing protein [Sedimentisphaerales bacterium]|nr:ASCH domain-containing protein [Sedimentisphaerales bacterium]
MRTHLAILKPQYLNLILAGKKTVESRLTKQKRTPFGQIQPGELIYLKQSSGPIRATAIAHKVKLFKNLTPNQIKNIEKQYNHLILGNNEYWHSKADAQFCTLVWLKNITPITPYRIQRSGMAAWDTAANNDPWKSKP